MDTRLIRLIEVFSAQSQERLPATSECEKPLHFGLSPLDTINYCDCARISDTVSSIDAHNSFLQQRRHTSLASSTIDVQSIESRSNDNILADEEHIRARLLEHTKISSNVPESEIESALTAPQHSQYRSLVAEVGSKAISPTHDVILDLIQREQVSFLLRLKNRLCTKGLTQGRVHPSLLKYMNKLYASRVHYSKSFLEMARTDSNVMIILKTTDAKYGKPTTKTIEDLPTKTAAESFSVSSLELWSQNFPSRFSQVGHSSAKISMSSSSLQLFFAGISDDSDFVFPLTISSGHITFGDPLTIGGVSPCVSTRSLFSEALSSPIHSMSTFKKFSQRTTRICFPEETIEIDVTSVGLAEDGPNDDSRFAICFPKLHYLNKTTDGLPSSHPAWLEEYSKYEMAELSCIFDSHQDPLVFVFHICAISNNIICVERFNRVGFRELQSDGKVLESSKSTWSRVASCLSDLLLSSKNLSGNFVLQKQFKQTEISLKSVTDSTIGPQTLTKWLSLELDAVVGEHDDMMALSIAKRDYLPPCTWPFSKRIPFTFPPSGLNDELSFTGTDGVCSKSGDFVRVVRTPGVHRRKGLASNAKRNREN